MRVRGVLLVGAALGALVLSTLSTSCSRSPLFAADTSVHIVAPGELSEVTLPLQLTWRATGTPRTYAVFVDRSPVHPGQSLRSITDLSCKRTPGCPTDAELATYGVLVTTATAVTIPDVMAPTGVNGADQPAVHRATVVFVDGARRRVGESAFTVDFRVRGSGT